MNEMTSRERMLRALHGKEADHVPCCFMSFTALRKRFDDDLYELAKAEQAMGLDSMLFIPVTPRARRPEHPDLRGLPVRFHAAVETKEWREESKSGPDVLHREYTTPGGNLSTSVRLSGDWPHGDHVPFVDDYQVPRSTKPLVSGPQDLNALRYLLVEPDEEDAGRFEKEAREARAFVEERGLLLAGGWGVGMDLANWLCGMQALMVMTMEQPAFVVDLLEMIHEWNVQRMKVVLSAPVDLYVRRAWYEGCDFVTPRFHRRAILPLLKAEVDLVHEHGAAFGYICSSGIQPMLDLYLEAGIDVLVGVDPIQGTHTDLERLKEQSGGRMCLWGGVSGAVTVELGSEEEVRTAVRHAIDTLGPTGLVLSPVDNVTVDAPRTWRNVDVLIDEWQRRR